MRLTFSDVNTCVTHNLAGHQLIPVHLASSGFPELLLMCWQRDIIIVRVTTSVMCDVTCSTSVTSMAA